MVTLSAAKEVDHGTQALARIISPRRAPLPTHRARRLLGPLDRPDLPVECRERPAPLLGPAAAPLARRAGPRATSLRRHPEPPAQAPRRCGPARGGRGGTGQRPQRRAAEG